MLKPLTISLEGVLVFATKCHAGQIDKQGAPYILHPLRVCLDLVERFPDVWHLHAVALLHDVVENCGVTAETLEEEFGVRIARLVLILTRGKHESYREYIDRVAADPGARVVKKADLRDNLRPDRPISKDLEKRYRKALFRLELGEWPC